jgi:hypothetical protein
VPSEEIDTTLPLFLSRRLSVQEREQAWVDYRRTWQPRPPRAPTPEELQAEAWHKAARAARERDREHAEELARLRALEERQKAEERIAAITPEQRQRSIENRKLRAQIKRRVKAVGKRRAA